VTLQPAELVRFALVLVRVSGIVVFAPFFGGSSIPAQIKVILVLTSTLALLPVLPLENVPDGLGLGDVALSILGQAVVGLMLGLAASFVFAGLQLAGQIIAFQLGFSLVNEIVPQSQVESSVVSILENFLGLLLFLACNGHHWFFSAVADSFVYLPVSGVRLQPALVEQFVRLSAGILVSGLQIAGPVLAVTVIADVILGVIGRAAPQINILVVGLPLKTLVGFACLSVAFYFMPQLLGRQFLDLSRVLSGLVRALA
jgi:flagellar biosynthetic protein FliR